MDACTNITLKIGCLPVKESDEVMVNLTITRKPKQPTVTIEAVGPVTPRE